MGACEMPDWLVAEADQGKERRAAEDLAHRGFHCYQPKFRERRVVKGRKVWFERLLLDRFLLVELLIDWARQYHDMLAVLGVRRVLMADERPLLARSCEVDRLRNVEVRGYVPVPKKATFKPGDRVWVDTGPFAGSSAKYESEDDVGDPTVLVEFLGALVPLNLTAGSISLA